MNDAARSALELPVYRHEDEIIAAVRDHPVVVVEGPTGSGKTTQLPRILLHAGFVEGMIGVTQPRRIAAVSVAWRIAEEMGASLGQEVGYAIRFDDRTGPNTVIKVMTDGILLQEARSDADFKRYGVVMVDEAHERSLNIDFTLGLLRRALEHRSNLRVVISSATLDPEKFQRFFAGVAGNVPPISIDARPFPVEMVHRPLRDDGFHDVVDACAREVVAIHRSREPGHVLVFLTGMGMIIAVEDAIRRFGGRAVEELEILPLYGRLTREEQERVFQEFPGKRKVVLATNIAETSITIPDVRFVVDCGFAKVPRVQGSTGITSLREEGISRASADQRAGRAGRTAPGRAIRLYSRDAYLDRPRFTDEEILRLDLTDVALRLIDIGIRDLEDFPFPTPPPRGKLKAALGRLRRLGAIDDQRALTAIGRRMVPFPLAPALSRMIVEAAERFPNVVDDVCIVSAFLSAQSPILYPPGEEAEARAAFLRYARPGGDAETAVNIVHAYEQSPDPEAFCKRNYFDAPIMAFVAKAHRQIAEIAEGLGIEVRRGGSTDDLLRCVAVGFADNLMIARGRWYEGPGDTRVGLHPASSLFGSPPRFVVASGILVARRPQARFVSAVKAEWVPEIDEEAARRWRVRVRGDRERGKKVDPVSVPEFLELAGARLPVRSSRGRVTVDIPFEALEALRATEEPVEIPPGVRKWKARVLSGPHRFHAGTPLGELVALVRHIPIPEPDASIERHVMEGALLEADRNVHALGRALDRLLQPALPLRGRRPGWLALVANGGGGYWLEVMPSYPDALDATLDALDDLVGTLPDDDRLQARLAGLGDTLRDRRDALDSEAPWLRRSR